MSSDQTVPITMESEPTQAISSKWADVWRQFKSHRGAVWGGGFLVFITLFVLLGPIIWWVDPNDLPKGREFLELRDTRPIYVALWDDGAKVNWAHPWARTIWGRDLLAKLIAGGQVSLAVGWVAMVLALVIGAAIGVVAGYFKRLDGPLMRLTDLFLALPLLPLLLVMMLLFREPLRATMGTEAGTFLLIVVVIGITSWMQTARVVRGDILALKEREFVLPRAPSARAPARSSAVTCCPT